jgi:ArsR family transcriptional regulator, arsenate/arsenite/antimonite-responsive transcriptional repressor
MLYFDNTGNMESMTAVTALSALAQQTRLAIYRMLIQNRPDGLTAGSIGRALELAPATLSFHLRELSHAGLVRARQQSRFIYYRADAEAMGKLLGFLVENCCPASRASEGPASESSRIAAPAAKPVVRPKTRVA